MEGNQFSTLRRHLLDPLRSRHAAVRLPAVLAWTSRVLLAVLMVAIALLPDAPFVSARVVQDAHCSLDNDGTKLLGSKAYAESFTALHNGTLISGYMETYNAQNIPATYTLGVWAADASGFPTGTTPLASATLEHPRSGYETHYPIFSNPPKLRAHQTYVVVVTVPDASINGVLSEPNDRCSGTFALSNTGAIGSFQRDSSNRDLVFSVNVKVKRHRHH